MILTVIVPIYKVEKYIEDCLISITSQIIPDIEIICVNDGSPDKSIDIAKEFISKLSPHIREQFIIINQENKGLSEARNVGISKASGRYISFLDSDDKLCPEYFSRILEVIDKFKPCLIDFNIITSSGKNLNLYNSNKKNQSNLFRAGLWFSCARVYEKNIISDSKFISGIYYEDMGFVPEVYLKVQKKISLDISLYWYRINPDGITLTRSDESYKKSIFSFNTLILKYDELYSKTGDFRFGILLFGVFFTKINYMCVAGDFSLSHLFMQYKEDAKKIKIPKRSLIKYLNFRKFIFLFFPILYIVLLSLIKKFK